MSPYSTGCLGLVLVLQLMLPVVIINPQHGSLEFLKERHILMAEPELVPHTERKCILNYLL